MILLVRFPQVKWDLNPIYLEQDRLITSAGTAASMDCCLSIVRKLYGVKLPITLPEYWLSPLIVKADKHNLSNVLFLVPHLIIISMSCLLI